MELRLYQADAFAKELFSGNPAAICMLDQWLSDDLMQKIAMENNLAETAFIVKENDRYLIRWFTPATEVDLCGHATLASAAVLYQFEGHKSDKILFDSPRSGELPVYRVRDQITLNFPADTFNQITVTNDHIKCFNQVPYEAYKGKTDFMFVFHKQQEIIELKPDLLQIRTLDARGLIATAKGDEVDFVSRFFAPQSGIDEDPVTGSAHTTLTPFWSEKLGKKEMKAIQLSPRKGYLHCTQLNDRVEIGGQVHIYLTGKIYV